MMFHKVKNFKKNIKRRWKDAGHYADNQAWSRSYARKILPSRIEVFDTNLLFNQRAVVRTLVCGLPTDTGSEGYPRDFSSKTIEQVQNLTFSGVRVMISTGLIQLPGHRTKETLEQAHFDAGVRRHQNDSEGTEKDGLELMMKNQDIVQNYSEIYYKSQKAFHASFVVVLRGPADLVFEAESKLINIIRGENIEVTIPSRLQLEMLQTALPGPDTHPRSWVEVRSDGAAVLSSATNLNSRTDDTGMYFGKDMLTNNEIVYDLDRLAAKTLAMCGATGSGKTYAYLLLLMRLKTLRNARIIYTTPKADEGTNYRSVAGAFGENGCIADIGINGSEYFNPLDILIDEESMGLNKEGMESARKYIFENIYDLKKGTLINAHRIWLASEFSSNMASYLDESLDWVYEQSGIYRDDPSSFSNPMPVYPALRFKWELDKENKNLGTKQKTAEALYNKTYQFSSTGLFNRYCNQTKGLDLNKDFIIIDMANVPDEIKTFMSVIVNGAIASRFSTHNERETYLAIDEGGVYLRDKLLRESLLQRLTQGRSHKFYQWIATHQPSDFSKNGVGEDFRTNTYINILMGNNIKKSLNDVKEYFELTESECAILSNCDVGQGLLLFGDNDDERVPIYFESTEWEHKTIKGIGYEDKKTVTDSGLSFKREFKWLISEHKIIFSDWIDGDPSVLLQQGYEKHQMPRIEKRGTVGVFMPIGSVRNGRVILPHMGDMKLDHYSSVIQLAPVMQAENFEEITINHNQDVDIKGVKNGKWLGLEYEIKGSHTTEELIKKKAAALENGIDVRFICSSADYPFISGAVGEDYTLTRGSAVVDFLRDFGADEKPADEKPDIQDFSESELIADQIEA